VKNAEKDEYADPHVDPDLPLLQHVLGQRPRLLRVGELLRGELPDPDRGRPRD
jgi:hypothetical protein